MQKSINYLQVVAREKILNLVNNLGSENLSPYLALTPGKRKEGKCCELDYHEFKQEDFHLLI